MTEPTRDQTLAIDAEAPAAPAPPLAPPVAPVVEPPAEAAAGTAEADAPAAPRRHRRLALAAGLLWIVRWLFAIALFVMGLSLGNLIFQATTAPDVAVVDPATNAEPPAVVREFIGALAADDADAIRSSLAAEPHARLVSEMKRFEIAEITSVETLSTHVDGTRTATAVVIKAVTTTGVPIAVNLVILADGATIEGFR